MMIKFYNDMNNRLLLLLLSCVTALCASAADENPDTIASIADASRVTVVRSDKVTTVTVRGADGDDEAYYEFETERAAEPTFALSEPDWTPAFPFTLARHRHALFKTTYFNNMILGAAIPVSAPAAVKASVEFGILDVVGAAWRPWYHGPEFSVGVGACYRQFAVGDRMRLDCVDRQLMLVPLGDDTVDKYSSRMRFWSFTLPVTVRQNIYRSLSVMAGAVVNFNSYTMASTSYHRTDGYSVDSKFRGLHQRLVTVDVMASLNISDIGVYVKYSPMRMFSEGWGPDMRAISVGLIIGY